MRSVVLSGAIPAADEAADRPCRSSGEMRWLKRSSSFIGSRVSWSARSASVPRATP
jgi:hypothetical protein